MNSLVTLFSGGSPGSDINYDPDFDIVKAEIGKSGNVDYKLLETKSFSLLNEKSKDIRLFAFLAYCYIKDNNWSGFCDVFDALAQLSIKNFDSLFPTRLQGKKLALKWLEENRFVDTVATAIAPADAHEDIKRLAESLDNFKIILQEKFPDGSPFPSRLHGAALKWVKSTEPKKEIVAPPPPVVQVAASSTSSNNVTSPVQASMPVAASANLESPKDVIDAIRKYAIFLVDKEPQKAIGYRLLRTSRWDSIEALPVAEGSVTKIEPPSQERRAFVQSLLEKGDYKAALETAEKTFSSGTTLYWLDLQRISATAASHMGKTFAAVKDGILRETASFLNRFPQVKNLSYIDETPFCSAETHSWLDKEVCSLFSDSSSAGPKTSESESFAKEKQEVEELLTSKSVDAALDFLVAKIAQCGNEQENFRRRIVIASCMLTAKRADIALYILETLHDLINRYNLVIWDPTLAVEALSLLSRAYDTVAKGKQGAVQIQLFEKKDEVIKKISYIDPKAAFRQ